MKILITENQLEKIIYRYFDLQFKKLRAKESTGDYNYGTLFYDGIDFKFSVRRGGGVSTVDHDLYHTLQSMFSLSNQECRIIIYRWLVDRGWLMKNGNVRKSKFK